jgi:hypothetical protein
MGVRSLGAAGLLCVTIASGALQAQAPPADHPLIEVPATGVEPGHWRSLLAGGQRKMPRRERAILLDPRGQIVGTAEGSSHAVMLPSDLVARLCDPVARLTIVHNHPGGTGLSQADLRILGFPGMGVVIAIGHEGSEYIASAGPAFDRETEDRIHRLARDRIADALRRRTSPETVALHLGHLVSLALARSDWLAYQATLGDRRRASYEARQDLFELAVARTAHELREHVAKWRQPGVGAPLTPGRDPCS